jgi:[glutamine synthetase] adenylyltransferase / [glutamine synthetase]-adenylyl-L-tyrosine phosphorylase
MAAILSLRRHELLRIAMADMSQQTDLSGVGRALSDLTGATVHVALEIAVRKVEEQVGAPLGTDMAAIGMGSLGAVEMGYASDADVIFVHRATGDVSDDEAQRRAVLVVQEVRRLFGPATSDPQLTLDNDLRPEGKAGPLVRSLSAYTTYYERWAATWEFQALLRARPVGGDPSLGQAFIDVIEPVRYPANGLTAGQVREIRLMKARVEAERLPRGGDNRTHLKLGLGGLTDVEWTVQLMQLQHAAADPSLRTTSTMEGLDAAQAAGHLSSSDARDLRAGWTLAAAMRNASVLWRGRPVESVPADMRDADGIGRIIGRPPGAQSTLEEDYLRVARRSRSATDRNFYEAL